MTTTPIQPLADELRNNPWFFRDEQTHFLHMQLSSYLRGELPADEEAEAKELIRSNPLAQQIHSELQEAEQFSSTRAGEAMLNEVLYKVLGPAKPNATKLTEAPCSKSSFLTKVLGFLRSPFSSNEENYSIPGMAFAQMKEEPEVKTHLDSRVATHLWLDGAGLWHLRFVTDDAACRHLVWELQKGAPSTIDLEEKNGWFSSEVILQQKRKPSHPQVRINTEGK